MVPAVSTHQRKEPGWNIRAGQNQRVRRAAGTIRTISRRRKVVGKVRRDGVQAGRVKVPAFVLIRRALVQNQRIQRRIAKRCKWRVVDHANGEHALGQLDWVAIGVVAAYHDGQIDK